MIIKCENIFCVYWLHGHCKLSTISLGLFGNCLDCIVVDVDELELEQKRKELLRSLEYRFADNQ